MKNSARSTKISNSVLNIPPKNMLIQASSPREGYDLYHVLNIKVSLEAYKIIVPKVQLFNNLEIYEWRNITQFPISKTRYVSIQPQIEESTLQQGIELLIYIEHCPLKLNKIYELSLTQTIYILKESYIGFERLYNKFGPFQISDSMIGINQKGFCKVWLNQNYAINSIQKKTSNEQNMIYMVKYIVKNHCQESKASRKLFDKLKNCKSFLSTIKQIDSFTASSKLIIPTKYFPSNSSCRQNRQDTFNTHDKGTKTQCISQTDIRYSIFSNKSKVIRNKPKQKSIPEVLNLSQKPQQNQLKRFKSLSRFQTANIRKISDGQTAYTGNNNTKNSNIGVFHNSSSRQTNFEKTIGDTCKKQVARKWLQDSTFVMEIQDQTHHKQPKQKKQMSHSTSIVNKTQERSRKLSANISNQNSDNPFYKFLNQNSTKKSQQNQYASQFALILDDQQKQKKQKDNPISTPRIKIIEQDQQKYKDEHTQKIIKNNGWNLVNTFLTNPKQLNESFHEVGKEENNLFKQIKLDKLNSIGRRHVAMSILPEQLEDII